MKPKTIAAFFLVGIAGIAAGGVSGHLYGKPRKPNNAQATQAVYVEPTIQEKSSPAPEAIQKELKFPIKTTTEASKTAVSAPTSTVFYIDPQCRVGKPASYPFSDKQAITCKIFAFSDKKDYVDRNALYREKMIVTSSDGRVHTELNGTSLLSSTYSPSDYQKPATFDPRFDSAPLYKGKYSYYEYYEDAVSFPITLTFSIEGHSQPLIMK